MHADSGAAPQAAEEAGVYVIGYNNDMSKYAPTKHLTAPVWDWGKVYTYVAGQVIKGTWKSEDIWWGLKEGLVDLAPFGKEVPEPVKEMVKAEKDAIINGKHVFVGPIKNQKGEVVVKDGVAMTDEELLGMNWFVEGVEGDVPN
jgi:basic membrane protein A